MSGGIVNSPFLDEVRAAFEECLNRGAMRIRASAYDEQAFGNAEVILEGPSFLVRLLRDRGDVFADACPLTAPEEWRPLERTLQAIGAAGVHGEGLISAEKTAQLVEEHFSALGKGLSPEGFAPTRRRLELLDADALKRAKERWKKGPAG